MNSQDLALTRKLIDKYGGGTVSDDQLNSAIDKKIADGTIASGEQLETIAQEVANKTDISDSIVSTSKVWSSAKTQTMIQQIPKGDKGEQGLPGTATISIDDTKVNTSQTWSSSTISKIDSHHAFIGLQLPHGKVEITNNNTITVIGHLTLAKNGVVYTIYPDNTTFPEGTIIGTSGNVKTWTITVPNMRKLIYDSTNKSVILGDVYTQGTDKILLFSYLYSSPSGGLLDLDNKRMTSNNTNDLIKNKEYLDKHNLNDKYIHSLCYRGLNKPIPNRTNLITFTKMNNYDMKIQINFKDFSDNIDVRLSSSKGYEYHLSLDKTNSKNVELITGELRDGIYTFDVKNSQGLFYEFGKNRIFTSETRPPDVDFKYTICLAFCGWHEINNGLLKEIKDDLFLREVPNQINDISNKTGQLPSFYETKFKNVVDRINEKYYANGEISAFVFMTDTHYNDLYKNNWSGNEELDRMFIAVGEICKTFKIDAVLNGGDIFGGDEQISSNRKKVISNYYKSLKKAIGSNTILLQAKGNHEDSSLNNKVGNYFDVWEQYNSIVKQNDNLLTFDTGNEHKLYHYYDDEGTKTRYIVLNSIDLPYNLKNADGSLKYRGQTTYAFSNEQLNWVANKALNFKNKSDKEKWKVVTISHVMIIDDITDTAIINKDVMEGILNAFKLGTSYTSVPTDGDFAQNVTVDFTEQGVGNLAINLSGHTHRDIMREKNNIKYVSTTNAFRQIAFTEDCPQDKVLGTDTECAFDVVIINKSTHKINFVRFGAGEDREYSF